MTTRLPRAAAVTRGHPAAGHASSFYHCATRKANEKAPPMESAGPGSLIESRGPTRGATICQQAFCSPFFSAEIRHEASPKETWPRQRRRLHSQ